MIDAEKLNKLKKVDYTRLNVISLNHEYVLVHMGYVHEVSIPMNVALIGDAGGDLKERLYQAAVKIVGNEDFILVPSLWQMYFEAYQEDQMRHPYKYPMGSDESIGGFGFRDDS
jgi:hypothetical protein